MSTKIHWIEQFPNRARLGIMARPRGNEWLDDEISSLKKQNVTTLISLLESSEIGELGLREEGAICSRHGIEFINFPVEDRNIPMNKEKIDIFIASLDENINKSSSIVIHCRMGIGRSSIIAGSVLLLHGQGTDNVLHRISSARGLKVPDTEEQIAWLRKREKTKN